MSDSQEHPELSALLRESVPQHSAPADLRAWAVERARAMDDAPASAPSIAPRSVSFRRGRYVAGLVAALLVGWVGHGAVTGSGISARAPMTDELVDSHVRSLMLDHLVDVRSTDRHTVKPWFAGKADIAPAVPELAPAGFPLIGGRLDYVGGHAAPTLVYGRRQHIVNLYIWRASPAERGASAPAMLASRDGYHVLRWAAGGLVYSAVSDVDPVDLGKFREAYVSSVTGVDR